MNKDESLLYLRQGCLGAVERACLMRVIADLAVFWGGGGHGVLTRLMFSANFMI